MLVNNSLILRNDLPKFYDTHYMITPITNREITNNNQINSIYKINRVNPINNLRNSSNLPPPLKGEGEGGGVLPKNDKTDLWLSENNTIKTITAISLRSTLSSNFPIFASLSKKNQ
nr:hypothetical protein [Trentepohlia sp. YN1317]